VTDSLKPEFKYGQARPTLTSVMPYCANGQDVVIALCEICGTIKGFTFRNSEFPDSGYWTECRACQSWTMFYRVQDAKISRRYLGDTEKHYHRKHADDTAGETGDDERWSHHNLMSSLGDSKTVAQVEWLNIEIKRRHPAINTTTEMLASIRNELCRFAEIQRRLFKAQNTLNWISRYVQKYWQP
jgi:hypothetical protein